MLGHLWRSLVEAGCGKLPKLPGMGSWGTKPHPGDANAVGGGWLAPIAGVPHTHTFMGSTP